MVLGGPTSQCVAEDGGSVPGNGSCNYGTPGEPGTESPGWASYNNTVTANEFAGSSAGVVLEGAFAPTFMGLSPGPERFLRQHVGDNTWGAATATSQRSRRYRRLQRDWGPSPCGQLVRVPRRRLLRADTGRQCGSERAPRARRTGDARSAGDGQRVGHGHRGQLPGKRSSRRVDSGQDDSWQRYG